MLLQSVALHFVFPIGIVWLTAAASIQSCSAAQGIREDDFPEYTYECESPCEGSSFCGRDLKCHTYSCDNWYTLGHPTMTGYTPDKSPTLNCEILENSQDRSFLTQRQICVDGFLPTSVSFLEGCEKLHLTCSYGSAPVAHMNRKCTSIPSDGFGFVCYEVAPDTDLEAYFDDYVAATSDLDPVPCTEDDVTSTDNHFYTVDLFSPRIGTFAGFSSSEFNVTLAMRTVVARLFEAKLSQTLFPWCEDGCKETEFCGQDGTCYEFNCFNVYDYGPKTVTGHDYQDTSAPNRECSNAPPTNDDSNPCLYNPDAFDTEITSTVESPWPLLVRFHCSRYEMTANVTTVDTFELERCAYDFLEGRYATLNRFCSAQPNPYQTSSCYDMDPDTDMEQYLADYLNRTTFNSECTIDNLNLRSSWPPAENATIEYHGRHAYMACIESDSQTDCTLLYGPVGLEENELTPIDFERLRYILKSNIVGSLPEENGTTSPVDSSSVATNNVPGTAVIAVFVWIGLIVWP